VLENCFTDEDADILKAMILGEKGFLSAELKDLYQSSGIIHILAI
jgi:competence protein ComEC